MYISGESLPIYVQHMNSLASIIQWGVLYTKDIDANTENDDDTAKLHKLSWPRVKIVKNQSFQDHHILPKCKLLKISPFKTTK